MLDKAILSLSEPLSDAERENLRQKFERLMKGLYQQKGATFKISLLASDEAQDFINTHAAALDNAFQKVEMSDAMRRRLQRSDYVFSGLKTFHELNEAFPSLLDENGERKSFEQFLNDVQSIDSTYNRNYLRAEFNFIHNSAQMAAKWESYANDGDRYYLQYRTMRDSRVRPKHRELDGITLPMSDHFWTRYYPPNGWNCRCTVVQVRRNKYPATPSDEAEALGESATDDDKRGMFHFNPGIEQKTVPDYNPYTIRRCRDCDIAKGKTDLAYVPENELCAACRLIRSCGKSNTEAASRLEKYNKKNWEHTYTSPSDNGLVATQRARINEATASSAERQKFEKETRMCKVLADNGHDVEHLSGLNRTRGKTYDITLDGTPAELKCITGKAGNLVKYVRKALTKQGGKAVIFELHTHRPEYYAALAEARRKYTGRILFYFADDRTLREIT